MCSKNDSFGRKCRYPQIQNNINWRLVELEQAVGINYGTSLVYFTCDCCIWSVKKGYLLQYLTPTLDINLVFLSFNSWSCFSTVEYKSCQNRYFHTFFSVYRSSFLSFNSKKAASGLRYNMLYLPIQQRPCMFNDQVTNALSIHVTSSSRQPDTVAQCLKNYYNFPTKS